MRSLLGLNLQNTCGSSVRILLGTIRACRKVQFQRAESIRKTSTWNLLIQRRLAHPMSSLLINNRVSTVSNLVMNTMGFYRCSSASWCSSLSRNQLFSSSVSSVCLFRVPRTNYATNTGSIESSGNEPPQSSSAKKISRPANLPPSEGVVDVIYFRGLPQITVPLPSRREKCRFILKPLTNSVGDLLHMIQNEDKGIDRVTALSEDGTRIASSNTIEMLMEQNFNLIINETVYHVLMPPQEKPSQEELERLSSVRNLVGQLYAALNVDEHQLRHEREMTAELERLQSELGPLEEKKAEIDQISNKKTNTLTWIGLGLMSVQFGVLARLTWWEYSWDIMEPVTYFVTYGTTMLAYAYFVITKQDYILPEVRDRQCLIAFHKNARKLGMDINKYNELRTKAFKIEQDLHRLRDPLALHLPLRTRLASAQELQQIKCPDTAMGMISKAQQKFQEILQKAQKTSPSS